MNQYKIDFTPLTIGDILMVVSANPSLADFLIFCHKAIDGGIFHLPLDEIQPILKLVMAEFLAWQASTEFAKWVSKNES